MRHASCHRQGRIARIRANLYNSLRLVHLAEHGEQNVLGVDHIAIRGPNELRVRWRDRVDRR